MAALLIVACAGETPSLRRPAAPTVVFVCEHGNVKSLIAASLFNREAAARHQAVRAVARGLAPEASVAPAIATALRAEGFEVGAYRPTRLGVDEVREATRVVAISVDPAAISGAQTKLEVWSNVPPASIDYPASRAALVTHVERLLGELAPSPTN